MQNICEELRKYRWGNKQKDRYIFLEKLILAWCFRALKMNIGLFSQNLFLVSLYIIIMQLNPHLSKKSMRVPTRCANTQNCFDAGNIRCLNKILFAKLFLSNGWVLLWLQLMRDTTTMVRGWTLDAFLLLYVKTLLSQIFWLNYFFHFIHPFIFFFLDIFFSFWKLNMHLQIIKGSISFEHSCISVLWAVW